MHNRIAKIPALTKDLLASWNFHLNSHHSFLFCLMLVIALICLVLLFVLKLIVLEPISIQVWWNELPLLYKGLLMKFRVSNSPFFLEVGWNSSASCRFHSVCNVHISALFSLTLFLQKFSAVHLELNNLQTVLHSNSFLTIFPSLYF